MAVNGIKNIDQDIIEPSSMLSITYNSNLFALLHMCLYI